MITLRELLDKIDYERVDGAVLYYDGCETIFDEIADLEDEAIEYGFIDEDVINSYVIYSGTVLVVEM